MSQTPPCPYCGSPVGLEDPGAAGPGEWIGAGEHGLGPLYSEVRRIREIAESREAADRGRRIAELTREVAELRATVARLRGSPAIISHWPTAGSAASPARPPHRR
jgi:hypothetical protein